MKPTRATLWTLLFSATLTVMAGAVIAPAINLIRDSVGVSQASAGLIITTHALFIALFSPIVGWIIDKVGTRKPFVISLFVYGLAGGAGMFVSSYYSLLATRAVLGIAVATVTTSISVMIINQYHGDAQNKVMGWRGSANSVGGIIWPLLGGTLATISWHLPFSVYFIGIILGFIALIAVPETHEISRSKGSVLAMFKKHRVLLAVYGLVFLNMFFLYSIVVFVPRLLETLQVTSPVIIGLFISAMTLSAAVVSFAYGHIKKYLSYKSVVLVTVAVWMIAFLVLSIGKTPFIVGGVVLFGLGMGLLFPAVMVWIGGIVEKPVRGRFLAYLGTFGLFGQFFSPIVLGKVGAVLGLTGMFFTLAVVSLIVFLLFLTLMG